MRRSQRGVKIFAIVLAIILIIIIVYLLFQALSFFKESTKKTEYNNRDIHKNIKDIDIDLRTASLTIDTCSKFRIDTDNEFVKIEIIDNKLRIKEKKHNPLTRKDTDSINLCIKDELNSIDLDMGAGKLEINELNAKKAEFDLGAGSFSLDNLKITDKFELDGGAGSITINDSTIYNSDIELGIGVLTFNGKLLGNNRIEGGVGTSTLNINGSIDDYKFVIEKGIGKVTINDKTYSSTTFGEGSNLISIETGVGNSTINFKNNE